MLLLQYTPLSVEGVLKGEQLVQEAPERPDVRLVVVRVVLKNLRRHVVRRADARYREVAGAPQELSRVFCFFLHEGPSTGGERIENLERDKLP